MDAILSTMLVFFVLAEMLLILVLLTTPTYSVSTFNITTYSGVLTINATFFGGITSYSHYIINNATEELPNGTIIRPAKSYVEAAIASACTSSNNRLDVGNGNYYDC